MKQTEPMNPEVKQRWVAELRSGKHVQGKGRLCAPDGSKCCLGVLQGPVLGLDCADDVVLSPEAQKLAGLEGAENPQVGEWSLAEYNDGSKVTRTSKTFVEIADLIEANL